MTQYPLSPRQLEDWRYHYDLKPDFAPTIMRIETDLADINTDQLKQAFAALIQKHESLRSTFPVVGGQVIQQVEPYSEKFALIYLEDYTAQTLQELSEKVILEMKDLANGPLIRGILYQKDENLYRLHIIIHHIVSDQWSVNIIKNDLQQLYLDPFSQPYSGLQLGEYILTKSEFYITGQQQVVQYWLSNLADGSWKVDYDVMYQQLGTKNSFPWKGLKGRDLIDHPTGASFTAAISEHLYQQLLALRTSKRSSMLNILLTAVNLLGTRLSRNKRILIQCHYACRQEPVTANIIGNLLGKLLILTDVQPDQTIASLMEDTAQRYQEATSHVLFSSEAFDELDLTTGNFVFFNFLPKELQNNATYTYKEPAFVSQVWAESPLVFQAFEYKNTIVVKWSYHLRFFNRELVAMMAAQFEEILELMADATEMTIQELTAALD
jgi:iturin family lipopeptide synthetase A